MKREGKMKKNEGGRKERKGSGVDGGAVENVESSTIDDDDDGAWTRMGNAQGRDGIPIRRTQTTRPNANPNTHDENGKQQPQARANANAKWQ